MQPNGYRLDTTAKSIMYGTLYQTHTFIKISFRCTLSISVVQKTKDKPKKNLRWTKELHTTKSALTKPEKGWLDYWVMILKNVNFWLVS